MSWAAQILDSGCLNTHKVSTANRDRRSANPFFSKTEIVIPFSDSLCRSALLISSSRLLRPASRKLCVHYSLLILFRRSRLMTECAIAKHFLLYFNWKIPTSLSLYPHILSQSPISVFDLFSSSRLSVLARHHNRSEWSSSNTKPISTIVLIWGFDFNWNL